MLLPDMQEVIIMSNSCDACGYRNAEVKGGGGVSEKGQRLTLKVEHQDDLRWFETSESSSCSWSIYISNVSDIYM